MHHRLLNTDQSEEVSSLNVNALSSAMELIPGNSKVLAAQQSLKAFVQDRLDQLGKNDLVDFAAKCEVASFDAGHLKAIMSRCGEWPQQAHELLPRLLKIIIQTFIAKAIALFVHQMFICQSSVIIVF